MYSFATSSPHLVWSLPHFASKSSVIDLRTSSKEEVKSPNMLLMMLSERPSPLSFLNKSSCENASCALFFASSSCCLKYSSSISRRISVALRNALPRFPSSLYWLARYSIFFAIVWRSGIKLFIFIPTFFAANAKCLRTSAVACSSPSYLMSF